MSGTRGGAETTGAQAGGDAEPATAGDAETGGAPRLINVWAGVEAEAGMVTRERLKKP